MLGIAAGGRLLAYRMIAERIGMPLPDDVRQAIAGRDVYELPLDLHIELMVSSWQAFAESEAAKSEQTAYVFECCFIQNPVTMGMIRCGADAQKVIDYIKALEQAVSRLNPLLVYVDQSDPAASFRKAVAEPPREWADGFMAYYLRQGYGAAHIRLPEILNGGEREHAEELATDATVEVLRARRLLEQQILDGLTIPVFMLDNSRYSDAERKRELETICTRWLEQA